MSNIFNEFIISSGLNILNRDNLDFVLSQNYTVLALWNSQNCISCGKTMWDVYKAVYSFLDEKTVLITVIFLKLVFRSCWYYWN